MKGLEAVLSRRSIRKYTDQPVPDEVVKQLLEAAMSAPSANNKQPWHFVVIRDREILDAIPTFHPYSRMLKEAALAILVCGDTQSQTLAGYWVQDCSAATQNILIAINALGLGGVWLGIYPRDERVEGIRKLVELPDHIVPLSLISIGHPAEKLLPSNRYDASRVHHNKW